jgi:Protein of unknown function (DUF2934)
MARSKSISGSKTSRAQNNKEQNGVGSAANLPDVKAIVETAPANVAPEPTRTREANVAPEARVTEAKPMSETRSASEPKPASEGRKFEVKKTDSRKNLVPINLEDEIRRRAYELYQQRGSAVGSEADDWLNAEREIRQRYRQQSA